MERKIILASQSPRRKELLAFITDQFQVEVADIDEKKIEAAILKNRTTEPFIQTARCLVETLAQEKAQKIYDSQIDAVIIGADTVVVHQNQILGKPSDAEEAFAMLRSYFGTTHQVITGVHIISDSHQETFSVVTDVTFWDWSKAAAQQVAAYIASGNPMDKAGAYGIQEMPSLWVKDIKGDYSNVIGLPISYVNEALTRF